VPFETKFNGVSDTYGIIALFFLVICSHVSGSITVVFLCRFLLLMSVVIYVKDSFRELDGF
jgi:hypothetical protein